MRVWIDLTNSPHVLVMRPVIERLRTAGHEVQVTARDFAQTLGLCERFGLECTEIGRHRGEGLAAKAAGLASRSLALVRWARRQSHDDGRRGFDIALGHGSNDVCVAAGLLRVPSATMFDYEWATLQHSVNCRLARAVVVPEAPMTAGFGAEIVARIVEDCFDFLEAPVLRVTGYDLPYPPATIEEHYVPSVQRILAAVDKVTAY